MTAVNLEPSGVRTAASAVRLATVGAGRIGANHAEIAAHRIPGAALVAVCDPAPGCADDLANDLANEIATPVATDDVDSVLERDDIDGVLITAPARRHTELVVAAAAAGKHAFVEKPMAVTMADADRAITAADAAGVVLQVGFNRRCAAGYAAARKAIDDGEIGTPQLLRSLTRDPGPFAADPAGIPPWTIFLETLIHDFDTLCWLNPGAKPVRVHATADALIRPDAKEQGHLDTAVVTVHFDNGAIGTAEASFSALYGYDVRAEAFGSAGMVTAGNARSTDMTLYRAQGVHIDTSRRDTDLLRSAYVAELTAFVDAIRHGTRVPATGQDARTALSIALAAIRSVETGSVTTVADVSE